MRMFNPDGTEDDCGNGLRCLARYVRSHHASRHRLSIESVSGVHTVEILEHGPLLSRVSVEMIPPLFLTAQVPVLGDANPQDCLLGPDQRPFTCLNTGSTHAVTFLDSPPDSDVFLAESPLIEQDPRFPERTSVIWAWPAGPNQLRIRIWERGVGETLACGTGACAAAVAGRLRGKVGAGPVQVASAGGTLDVEWEHGAAIRMTGPAETVFRGHCRGNS